MDEVKKLTIKDIRRMYEEKEPMSWISIYDIKHKRCLISCRFFYVRQP